MKSEGSLLPLLVTMFEFVLSIFVFDLWYFQLRLKLGKVGFSVQPAALELANLFFDEQKD